MRCLMPITKQFNAGDIRAAPIQIIAGPSTDPDSSKGDNRLPQWLSGKNSENGRKPADSDARWRQFPRAGKPSRRHGETDMTQNLPSISTLLTAKPNTKIVSNQLDDSIVLARRPSLNTSDLPVFSADLNTFSLSSSSTASSSLPSVASFASSFSQPSPPHSPSDRFLDSTARRASLTAACDPPSAQLHKIEALPSRRLPKNSALLAKHRSTSSSPSSRFKTKMIVRNVVPGLSSPGARDADFQAPPYGEDETFSSPLESTRAEVHRTDDPSSSTLDHSMTEAQEPGAAQRSPVMPRPSDQQIYPKFRPPPPPGDYFTHAPMPVQPNLPAYGAQHLRSGPVSDPGLSYYHPQLHQHPPRHSAYPFYRTNHYGGHQPQDQPQENEGPYNHDHSGQASPSLSPRPVAMFDHRYHQPPYSPQNVNGPPYAGQQWSHYNDPRFPQTPTDESPSHEGPLPMHSPYPADYQPQYSHPHGHSPGHSPDGFQSPVNRPMQLPPPPPTLRHPSMTDQHMHYAYAQQHGRPLLPSPYELYESRSGAPPPILPPIVSPGEAGVGPDYIRSGSDVAAAAHTRGHPYARSPSYSDHAPLSSTGSSSMQSGLPLPNENWHHVGGSSILRRSVSPPAKAASRGLPRPLSPEDGSSAEPGSSAGGQSGKYSCPYCSKRFNRPSSLKIHVHSHTGEKPYRCEVCGKGFSVSSNLRRHGKIHTASTEATASSNRSEEEESGPPLASPTE